MEIALYRDVGAYPGDNPEKPNALTLTEAIIPVASLVLLVALSYFLFGDAGAGGPNQVALVVATMIAVFIGWRRGHTLESLGEAASKTASAPASAPSSSCSLSAR